MKRIFVAIDIPDEVKEKVKHYQEGLKANFSHLRVGWGKNDKLHFTLKFIGELNEKTLDKLKFVSANLAKSYTRFKASAETVGVFPNKNRARILWLGINEGKDFFIKLKKELENKCENIGLRKDRKKYKLHLTIARLKEPKKSKLLVKNHLQNKIKPVEFSVSSIVIYESELRPTGSVYNIVSKSNFI